MRDKITLYLDVGGVAGIHVPQTKGESAADVAARFGLLKRLAPMIRRFDLELKSLQKQ